MQLARVLAARVVGVEHVKERVPLADLGRDRLGSLLPQGELDQRRDRDGRRPVLPLILVRCDDSQEPCQVGGLIVADLVGDALDDEGDGHAGERSEEGHSVRAITGALGTAQTNVYRDLEPTVPGGTVGSPERIIGLDGKSYPATQPRREPEPERRGIALALREPLIVKPADRPVEGGFLCLGGVGRIESDVQDVEDGVSLLAGKRDWLGAPFDEYVFDRVGYGTGALDAVLAELTGCPPAQVFGQDDRGAFAEREKLALDLEDHMHAGERSGGSP